jgi:signal transduction histidine kinase
VNGHHPAGTPVPFNTRRRLIAAFSVVFGAFVLAVSVQVLTLRRMEATFAIVEQREVEMGLALEVEDAVRSQFEEAAAVLGGESGRLAAYREAHARAVELSRALTTRLDDAPATALAKQIVLEISEFDRAMLGVDGRALPGDRVPAALRGGYGIVLAVEQRVDAIFRLLQRDTTRSHRELVELESLALRWTVVLVLVTFVFVAGAVLYLSRSVAQPLARLSAGAAALKRGDLETRIEVDTPDEFGMLAAEFNEMTAALIEHQRRLVETEKLASVGRLAAGVAHEINNPLQTILGYLSLNRDLPDRRLAEQLAAVEEEALRCKAIVEELLELSRPACGAGRGVVDLAALCEDVAGKVRVGVGDQACAIAVAGGGRALADGTKVRQALFNLVKNAVEASGPRGRVDVRIGGAGAHVEVDVRDSGPGLAQAARVQIFEPFFTTKAGGTGLGLAVSRAIARANGGDIAVRETTGRGAIFTLSLPRAMEGSP